MAKSTIELRDQLSDLEPTEATYEGIGPDDVNQLVTILRQAEDWLAERAVHALGRIDADNARQALKTAAADPRMGVRVAVAVTAGSQPVADANELLSTLLQDSSPAVRKFAIRSTSARNSPAIRQQVAELAGTDDDQRVRSLAGDKRASLGDAGDEA